MKETKDVLRELRIEKKLTQKELAEQLFVSDKTISKWERGAGYPDITVLNHIADFFNVSIDLLLGNVSPQVNKGIKMIGFYLCPNCGNIIYSSDQTTISCCDKKLVRQEAKKADEDHQLSIIDSDGGHLLTINHEMAKEHFISFVAVRRANSINIIETYPEWDLQVRLDSFKYSRVYYYCSVHGLYYQQIK